MDPANWIAIVAVVAGAVTAIISPALAYRFALQQDARRWAREQRSRLYVDLVVEARAETDWALREWTRIELRQIVLDGGGDPEDYVDELPQLPDDRMSSRDRKELGARMLVYASREVQAAFHAIAVEAPALPFTRKSPADQKVRVEEAFSRLEAQVRRELAPQG